MSLTFNESCVGYHHNQTDCVLLAYNKKNICIGYVEYSLYKSKCYIHYIEVDPTCRKKGIGKKLLLELTKEYPYDSIVWGSLTELGQFLKKSIDQILSLEL